MREAPAPCHPPCPILPSPRGPLTPPPLVSLQTVVSGPLPGQVVAPVSGNSLGVRRAEIKPGVREVHLCKDERGRTGLRLRAINKVGLAAWRERGWGTAPVSTLSHPSPRLRGSGCSAQQLGSAQRSGGGEDAEGAGSKAHLTNSQAQPLPLSPSPKARFPALDCCRDPAAASLRGSCCSEPPFPTRPSSQGSVSCP